MVVKIFIAYFWTNEENMIVHITEIVYKKRDEMSEEYVNLMMQKGLADAKAGRSCPVNSVFNDLRQKINDKQIRIQLTLRNLLKIN